MLYCPKCQSLQETDAQVCEICQEPILREPVPEDIVLFAYELSEFDADRLCAALSDADILFERKDNRRIVVTNSAGRPGHTVLVRYDSLQDACDIALGIGLKLSGDFSELGKNPALFQQEGEETQESEEEPNSKKKLISRIVLFAFFIGIVWAVVALSDTIIAFVKGLFTGG